MSAVNIARAIVWPLWIIIFILLVVRLALCGEDFKLKHRIRVGLIGTIAVMVFFEIMMFIANNYYPK